MIIGLAGYARSGKDSAAAVLVEKYGFTRKAFADPMREALLKLNPIVGAVHRFGMADTVRLSSVIRSHGWDGYKDSVYGPEVRQLMQRFGTEVVREMFGDDVWVELAMRNLTGDVVFTDVRFPNEADAIRNAGGLVVRVVRPGVGAVNGHPSESALNDYRFDAEVSNDGSLADLAESIEFVLEGVL